MAAEQHTAPRLTAADVLDSSEVAELLHIPQSTVEDYGRRDILPSVKIGRRRLFLRSKIEARLHGEYERESDR